MNFSQQSRRSFLKSASVVTAAAAFGSFIPSTALGANDRVRFGVIGNGGMGRGHLTNLTKNSADWNIEVPAVCDVYRRRLVMAQKICEDKGYKAEGYLDYRKVLERKDIDAVLIATPDHWHSKIAIDAMDAGKHVYVEKPMTLTAEQAIEVRNAVKKYNKVLQVGPQYTSQDQFWSAQKAIRENRLGKVTWAHGSFNRNIRGCGFNTWFKIDETAGPKMEGEDFVDWDMWLGWQWGLAPRIPWNPEHFFRFRKYFQYNGGVATDLLYHVLAPLLLAIAGENGEYPRRVNANGGLYIEKDGRDIPDVFMMAVDYPSEFTVYLESVLTNDTSLPTKIYGRYGTMEVPIAAQGNDVMTGNGDFVKEFRDMNNGYDKVELHAENTGGNHEAMEKNFIDVIRQGGKLFCNVDLGCATMVAIKMGVESYRQSKTMVWDAKNEKVVVS
ncbi:Gfo/Idh/MocA family oxidoreductase [bacterium]|nr:Gfo/Idh/MocA family oxidoreductase [bacterium]